MTSLTVFSRGLWRRSREIVRERVDVRRAPQRARDPEQVERIATYARAGYFHMSYTFDAFRPVGETPLD